LESIINSDRGSLGLFFLEKNFKKFYPSNLAGAMRMMRMMRMMRTMRIVRINFS